MTSQVRFNTLLVPVDFYDASREAFTQALHLVGGEDPSLIALHVIDVALVELLVASGIGDTEQMHPEQLLAGLRKKFEGKLAEFTQTERTDVQVSRVISVGRPFLEIIHKSADFAVDAIVMGKVGNKDRFEKLLFGSTAERVLRASARPVIVFSCPTHQELAS